MAALDEDAIQSALANLDPAPSSGAQAAIDEAMKSGRLGKRFVGGATSYFDPRSGLPLGAVADSRSPLGFYIADPGLREMYSNEQGGMASAVAQQNYMDAFQRDKLKNTLGIMQASSHLDPDLQELVLQKLGVRSPRGAASGPPPGIPTPGGYYLGARSGAGPNGEPLPIFAQPQQGNGFMGAATRREMAKLQFAHDLAAPDRESDRAIKEMAARTSLLTATSNDAYRRQLLNNSVEKMKNDRLAQVDNLSKAIKDQLPVMGDRPEVLAQKAALRAIYQGMTNKINAELLQLDANYGGGGPPNQGQITEEAATGGGATSEPYSAADPSDKFAMMLQALHGQITGQPQRGISAPVAPQTAAPEAPAAAPAARAGNVGGKRYSWTQRSK